jgi:hypothetical protein
MLPYVYHLLFPSKTDVWYNSCDIMLWGGTYYVLPARCC